MESGPEVGGAADEVLGEPGGGQLRVQRVSAGRRTVDLEEEEDC